MKKWISLILDLIYRKKCYFCGKSKESLKICSECFENLEFSDYQPNRVINGINIYTCGIYEKNLQKLIRGLKYHKQKDLAYYLAKFMYQYFSALNITEQFQVVPVPLHKSRIKKRKYNHMELVAEEFCKMSGFVMNKDLIKRIKNTKPQYRLTRKERMQNLFCAFEADKTKDLGLPILILDDICTTGATFEEMINELKKHNLTSLVCIASSSPN